MNLRLTFRPSPQLLLLLRVFSLPVCVSSTLRLLATTSKIVIYPSMRPKYEAKKRAVCSYRPRTLQGAVFGFFLNAQGDVVDGYCGRYHLIEQC
jgi:hypothetical protein